MLHLYLFGRPRLTRAESANGDIPVQGLSLAILAALAVAAPRGLTRDRVLLLLWPEVDGQHAGHRLTQLRYALRKTLLADPIVGTADLRLDPSVVLTDVQRFTEALAQEDHEQAVRLAAEPFLDGFSLRDAPEFERWVDGVRWEFEGRVKAALERLETAADQRGDARGAAFWLEQIVRRDPVNEAAAVRALAAYEAAGDHAQARRLGEWLERTLREEFDGAPEATLQAAIDRMRTGVHTGVPPRAAVPAIAVLPLRNISPEPENEFFSDGMTDEITGALARVPGLRVASRTSSYAFKGKAADVRQIADRLGVTLVVEGSLRKVGNRIRLVAQLVSAADGCELWSGTFERTIADVFELQTELATAIVGALPLGSMGTLPLGAKGAPPTDPETYTLYLKGRYWAYKRTVEALQLATEYFDQAVERDPGYAPGWTGIAECQIMLGFPEYCNLPPRQTMPRAKAAVARALELAPTLPEAHLLSGVLGLLYDWDWAASEQALQEALRLRPIYPLADCWYSMLLSALGRHEEAVCRVERASELDPLALLIHLTVGRALYFARRLEEALGSIRATAEMEPAHPLVRIWLCRALLALGRYDEALQAVEKSARVAALDGYVGCLSAAELVGLGRKEVVLNDPSSPWTFMVDARGRVEDSLAALERCWDERIGHLPWLAAEPLCDPLRQHPRFTALLERMGLAVVATPRRSPIAISSRNSRGLKVVSSKGRLTGA
jgi:adenylate cyclase